MYVIIWVVPLMRSELRLAWCQVASHAGLTQAARILHIIWPFANRKYMIGLPRPKDELTMKSSALQTIVWVLLIFSTHLQTQSQTPPAKKVLPSSISGKVTIKGKGAPGIFVVLRSPDYRGQQASRYKGTTDQEGNYQITNVPPGTYQVMPAAPAFVISGSLGPDGQGGKSLIIAEGETVKDIDFALTRGAVITGRVTDSEGRPLIEEQISLFPADQNNQRRAGPLGITQRLIQTDDRGIYRIFGVPPGIYKVAVGHSEDRPFGGGPRRSQFKQTFHPDAIDASKATVIDLTEGSEARDVDITVILGRRLDAFAVSGRIVDGETGQPLPNVMVGLQVITNEHSSMSSSGWISNNRGEFRLENLSPGKYSIFIQPQANSEMRADTIPFEIIDQDVTGLLIKTAHGASVSGVIVLEGTDDKFALARLNQLRLSSYVQNEGPGNNYGRSTIINQDGSFRVSGLQAGIANFSLFSMGGSQINRFTIARIERDGVTQLRGLEIKDGEQITNVRLVVNYGNGTIRGIVKAENGELPQYPRVFVWLTRPGDDPTNPQGRFGPSQQVDARGRFLVEGLAAGTYEVNVNVFVPGSRNRVSAKQQVNVADGVVTEVTLTVDLKPPDNP